MRVLILSQYYRPEPVPKPSDLAEALHERGHIVSVLTGFPNYPTGQLYPEHHLSLLQCEKINDIPIVRAFEFPYHGKQVVGRLLNYASFMLSAILASFCIPACDVIYVWHPPLSIGVTAWIISLLRRVPFIYDVQDIWPESAVRSGLLKDGLLTRFMYSLERFVYRQASHIIVVSDGARENLLGKGVPPEKLSVMPHWVDESLFGSPSGADREIIRKQYGWGNRFVALFAGNLGLAQGLETIVRAAALLEAESQVLIVLIGDGADKARLVTLVSSLGLSQWVQFIERQPPEKIALFMTAADALLVHLKRSELFKYSIPTKTIAYLAAGQPILMAMEGAAAQLVQEAGAGIVTQPENAEELAKAIQAFSKMSAHERAAMGQRGRIRFDHFFSKSHVIPQYENLLQNYARQSKS